MSQAGLVKSSGGGSGTVQYLEGNSGGEVGPNGSGVIFVVGTGGVTVAGDTGTNTLTVSVSGGGISWNDKATSFTAVASNGYFCTAALTATLPSSPSQGDTISVVVDVSASVVIQAATGQVIRIGNQTSSTAGTATSNAHGDAVTLVYRASNTTWFSVPGPEGTWTLA